jgi:two-component system chemotaxis response regulator CheY
VTSEVGDGKLALNQSDHVLLLPKPFTSAQLVQALSKTIDEASESRAPRQSDGKIDRSRLKVMIVDDSSTARINIRKTLEGLGFSQFLEVPDGAHAIAVASREVCDLFVTDYNMPLMNGRALVSYLKQNPATATIPIVMVTTDPQVLDPVRQMGVLAILEKAFPASVVGPLLDSLF